MKKKIQQYESTGLFVLFPILAVLFLLFDSVIYSIFFVSISVILFLFRKKIATIKFDIENNVNLFFCFLIFLPFIISQEHFALLMITTVCLYSTVALGMTIQMGMVGVANFAGAAFFGIGAYTTAILTNYFDHIIVIFLSGIFTCIAGLLLILPILRTKGHYTALITIAFSVMFLKLMEINKTFGGAQGLRVNELNIFGLKISAINQFFGVSPYFFYCLFSIILFLIIFFITKNIKNSTTGLIFESVKKDEILSKCFGINVAFVKISSFCIGNFIIGIAGGIFAMVLGYIAPTNFTFSDSLLFVSIIILGGIGNPFGVLPSAFILIVVPEKLQIIQEYRHLIFSIIIILILIYKPKGLFPSKKRSYLENRNNNG